MNSFKYALAGAALALAPITAHAATITSGDSGTNYDLLADSYSFDEDFGVGTAGGTLTYTFTNNDASTAAVTFFGFSVEQNLAAFTDGVELDFGTFSADVAEGESMGANTNFFVAAGDTVTLTITYGTVFDLPPSFPSDAANIDFSIQAALVPIPAAGLLLLTALGAAGAMRRRKAAA
ncbi:VPLPA-CTERM sorting domain-containing protein [Flavimaricola marinus]|uniref:VPLPA-CTERM protein sorting domain-containing protein n=1 Tax=Flavimaricola marinus TaxID=1819565 RepID=A0A238LI54_9RHOB|nr:VPLPA-CTERM sorting domain-containing protein [Flavimaricola marinus]SMY09292.1 hypothetical protein LOM8899_03457 [Flavimaricola marinus]